jgi:Uma2 family endonuclease
MTLIDDLSPLDDPYPRLLTVADFAALPTHLPSGDIKYELDRGRLIIVSPPARRHGRLQGRIVKEFILQGEEQGFGEAGTETAFVLSKNPATVYIPDVHFIAKRSFPVRETREGYLETPPDIAVEVLGKRKSRPPMEQKVSDYLAAGITEIWVVDPAKKTVTIHRASTAPRVLTEAETLTIADIIPGFSLPLAELFRD